MMHRYTFPQVRELLPERRDARPPERPLSQRELVAVSLLLRPPHPAKTSSF
jgi:hypothetical protein